MYACANKVYFLNSFHFDMLFEFSVGITNVFSGYANHKIERQLKNVES